jgi:hypothetical protein
MAKKQGFVLVISLVLMALLLLLMLSMSILLRVESNASSMGVAQLRAREAARFALMLALGDLQKYAGPDQRVTARAEIMGITNSHRCWTGVWDTTDPASEPVWLVSGTNPRPDVSASPSIITLQGYDQNGDGSHTDMGDYPDTRVPLELHPELDMAVAWSIIDEGVKAPVRLNDDIHKILENHPSDEQYMDYPLLSNRLLPLIIDEAFDYPELFDLKTLSEADKKLLQRAQSSRDLSLLADAFDSGAVAAIEASVGESATLQNFFVLSNPLEGGLKKDLSYLKTVAPDNYTQAKVNQDYDDPNGLLTPDMAQLIQFEGNPTAEAGADIVGMQLAADYVTDIRAKAADFSLSPVITEFQLTAGIAADDEGLWKSADRGTATDSAVYLVYKLYLEIWNPYTVPMRLGDPSLPASLGYSDLRIEVKNLPRFTITNSSTGSSISDQIPDISILWSDYASYKLMRPGMVYEQALPPDSAGDNKSGVIQRDLGITLLGSIADNYAGDFVVSAKPVTIRLYGVAPGEVKKEILRAEISNYPNYSIDYSSSNIRTRFKRRMDTSNAAISGMTKASLEEVGYAFAFKFRMLDEQEVPGNFEDISKLLSQYDFRNQEIIVDLNTWDINNAWNAGAELPYDFFLNDEVSAPDYFDPGLFNPEESFREIDFFRYGASSGRQDRIARVFDVPVGELTNISTLRSLFFSDYGTNALGNKWGGDLNKLYDRYFFSSLANPDEYRMEQDEVLANSQLKPVTAMPVLEGTNAAENLMLENGFNLNSTSVAAWKRVLRGKQIDSSELESRHELGDYPEPPNWFKIEDDFENAFFNLPHSSVHNLVERESNPRYTLPTIDSSGSYQSYLERLSIDSLVWQSNLQYPVFFQALREIPNAETDRLAEAIVNEIITYTADNERPPNSIAEFLNAGIMENAINRVETINNRTDGQDAIPSYTAGHISQATLMNMIGNKAFVRSDTFTVRAYAEVYNPSTGSFESSATCQARVVRLPEEHASLQMGRRFKILSFEWLNGL